MIRTYVHTFPPLPMPPRSPIYGSGLTDLQAPPGHSITPRPTPLPTEAMLTARAMLNRRRERITLQALQPVVESYSGKQFKASGRLTCNAVQ